MMMLAHNIFMNIIYSFLLAIDWLVYGLLTYVYRLFTAVASLNIFDPESVLYTSFIDRIYAIISIITIFIFAYQMILMIANPDDQSHKTSKFVKDVLISLIAVAILPTIFNYMQIFQQHILDDNTIGAIIMGGGANSVGSTPEETNKIRGKNIALMILVSNYYPQGMSYTDFYDSAGELYDKEHFSIPDHGTFEKYAMETYVDALIAATYRKDAYGFHAISLITGNLDLIDLIENDDEDKYALGQKMHYNMILSTVCGLMAVYYFLCYTFDLGLRAVKLFVLQIVAPLPVILRAFPGMKKMFENWRNELLKTYIDLFARMAFVFFIIYIMTMIPNAVNNLMATSWESDMGFWVTIVSILSLLKFAKEGPELIKKLFNTGGILGGIDLKPKSPIKHIEENPYAMRGLGMAAGLAGGVIGHVAKSGKSLIASGKEFGNAVKGHDLGEMAKKGGAMVMTGAGTLFSPRGIVNGVKGGFNSNPTKLNQLGKSFDQGIETEHQSRDLRTFIGDQKEAFDEFRKPENMAVRGREIKNKLTGENVVVGSKNATAVDNLDAARINLKNGMKETGETASKGVEEIIKEYRKSGEIAEGILSDIYDSLKDANNQIKYIDVGGNQRVVSSLNDFVDAAKNENNANRMSKSEMFSMLDKYKGVQVNEEIFRKIKDKDYVKESYLKGVKSIAEAFAKEKNLFSDKQLEVLGKKITGSSDASREEISKALYDLSNKPVTDLKFDDIKMMSNINSAITDVKKTKDFYQREQNSKKSDK